MAFLNKNTGPDGKNRCGIGRGQKCEDERYNAEMQAKKVTQEYAESNSENKTANNTILIYAVIAIVIVILIKKFVL